MEVINLIGGPNTGKTTTAFGLAFYMKMAGLRVEYVSEYAKDMVYESRLNILADQLYILAKQNRRLHRLRGKVDWVITDSPLLLGLVYARPEDSPEFHAALRSYWETYSNSCFYFPRNTNYRYDPEGRVQASHEEAGEKDTLVKAIMPRETVLLTRGVNHVREILEHLDLVDICDPKMSPEPLQVPRITNLGWPTLPNARSKKIIDRRYIGTQQDRELHGDDIYDRPA